MNLEWRKDQFGRPNHSLYLGDLYVGGIKRMIPAHIVQESNHYPQWLCDNPWTAWVMASENPKTVGYFKTEDEAKNGLRQIVQTLNGNTFCV